MSLSNYRKHCTSNETYIHLFNELVTSFGGPNHTQLYTDASKDLDNVAYAVVDKSGNTILTKSLSNISSIFTAEAAGIFQAINIANLNNKNFVIYSDSLSVLTAINNPSNNKWQTVNKIRDSLIKANNKIKIAWIPGHVGIRGNNFADAAAKYGCSAPIITDPTIEKNDLRSSVLSKG
ncbi:hypothetical protein EVAR_67296_1 [Eumeta japonica]|uniref:ribonuclease H n=1 Tax=Eumeta variegata TaxID=151549 RepID=A0A4C1TEB2_EUMVA|nr:hypothetical protein EVAR_67296_1 [Eumeta japonica]